MMSPHRSFDVLVDRLQAGDEDAAAHVFGRFARRLAVLAARHLGGLPRARCEAEDVVQSVFRSFFTRQQAGHFELRDWDGLWHMLVVITRRKCSNRVEYHQAACRDVRREMAVPPGTEGWQALDREPTPLEAAQLVETAERLLQAFTGRERTIVALRLEGYPVLEVCAQVGCSERKVYRVLQRARLELQRLQEDGEDEAA